MTNKEILSVIEKDVLKNISTNVFGEKDGYGKIGNNQFRSIADICKKAQCVEEIELLIKYNMSKCKDYESWNKRKGDKRLGEVILSAMEKLYVKDNDEESLKNLELFFGYMYWHARVLSAENARNAKNANKKEGNK